jgi:hypothetical protein
LPLAKQSLDEAPYKLSGAVANLAGITFSRLAFSYWIDNLGFITEGKLAAIFIKPYLGVSNWPFIYFINYTPTSFLAPSSPRHQQVFWRRCRGLKKKKLLHQIHIPPSTWHHQTQSETPLAEVFFLPGNVARKTA